MAPSGRRPELPPPRSLAQTRAWPQGPLRCPKARSAWRGGRPPARGPRPRAREELRERVACYPSCFPVLSCLRQVNPARVQRSASCDSRHGPHGARKPTVTVDRELRVLGTSRGETASSRKEGRNPALVRSQNEDQEAFHRRTGRRDKTGANSSRSSAKEALRAAGWKCTTTSNPLQESLQEEHRKSSRTRLFRRLRTTAPPTLRLAVSPKRALDEAGSSKE